MTKLDKEIEEGLYDPKMSKQKQFEKQCKAKAHEGKKLKGQQKLTGAVSTSKRLSEFAFDLKRYKELTNKFMRYEFNIDSPEAKEMVKLERDLIKKGAIKPLQNRTYDIKGIADSLRRQGIEPDLHDIAAEYDHSQSHSWNLKHIKDLLGLGGRRKQGDYEQMAEEFYKAQVMGSRQGWLAKASPQERAAAFARMRETGTLRGYDPKKLAKRERAYIAWNINEQKPVGWLGTAKSWIEMEDRLRKYKAPDHITSKRLFDPEKPATIYIITDANGNKKKATYAQWLKWMKEQKRPYDPKALSLPPTRWYGAMVKGIKKSSDVRNPYAIVKNIWAKLSPGKRAEIKAREKKGEQFKYNLPLPVDKPTTGTGTLRMVKPFKLAEVQVNLRVKDYLSALKSGIFSRMKRQDGTTALVARCKSPVKNVNIFVDKAGQ